MRVYRLKGGQRRYGGHVVNLPQNISGFVTRLPRAARALPIVVIRRLGGEGTHKDLNVGTTVTEQSVILTTKLPVIVVLIGR